MKRQALITSVAIPLVAGSGDALRAAPPLPATQPPPEVTTAAVHREVRALMEARKFDTAGHVIDPAVCLACFQTRPDQVRAAIARDERMAAELAAGLR